MFCCARGVFVKVLWLRLSCLLCAGAVLTTDVALLHDPSYLHWVKVYAESEETLRHAFKHGKATSCHTAPTMKKEH
jgi:catalase (peroxidase I)